MRRSTEDTGTLSWSLNRELPRRIPARCKLRWHIPARCKLRWHVRQRRSRRSRRLFVCDHRVVCAALALHRARAVQPAGDRVVEELAGRAELLRHVRNEEARVGAEVARVPSDATECKPTVRRAAKSALQRAEKFPLSSRTAAKFPRQTR